MSYLLPSTAVNDDNSILLNIVSSDKDILANYIAVLLHTNGTIMVRNRTEPALSITVMALVVIIAFSAVIFILSLLPVVGCLCYRKNRNK